MFPRLAVVLFGLAPLGLHAQQPLPANATATIELPIAKANAKPSPAKLVPFPSKSSGVLALNANGLGLWDSSVASLRSYSSEPVPSDHFWLAPDRTTLVTAHENRLQIWERIDWSKPKPFEGISPTVVESDATKIGPLVASPDGSLLAFPTKQNVRLYDLKRREWLIPLRPHAEPKVVAIAPNNRTVAVIGADSMLRIFSLATRQTFQPMDVELWRKRLPQNELKFLTFSPDGSLIATATQGKTVLLETLTGRYHKSIDREFGEGNVTCFCFSPDGLLVASALDGAESRIAIIDVVAGKTVAKYKGHVGAVSSMTFASENALASSGIDGKLILWDLGSVSRSQVHKPSLRNAYQQLDSPDAMTATTAVRSLIEGGDESVEIIGDGLDNSDEMQLKIQKWIAQLESDDFRPRELARKNLLEAGVKSVRLLREALKKNPPLDVEERIKGVLTRLEKEDKLLPPDGLYGEALTRLRAVYVLEQIPGEKAKALLVLIAKMTPDYRDGIEARMALERRGK